MNIHELERKYGSIEHAGKTYILTGQALLTNRLLPDHQTGCIELSAGAVDPEGDECVVYWIFEEDGQELDMYDYIDVDRVEAI